jgi:hypothetical protein
MTDYLDRKAAREFLAQRGIVLGPLSLQNKASLGIGPIYVIINGRALYTEEDLIAWVRQQASVPPRRRRAEKGPDRDPIEAA